MAVNGERQPLLKDHESRDDHVTKPDVTPLPWGPISVLLLMNALGPLAYELVFPFINQMLVELEITTDPERVGFYSGIIESVFSLASLMTILPMSYASDRFGRKPVIIFGITGIAISLVTFGISRTFPMLILTRCLSGALGGVWAAIKSMLGELTDSTNQSVAFSALTLAYRIGQIVGLPIGGFLAHPERHLPSVFNTPFWLYYPFLLPCLAGAAFAVIGVLLGLVCLTETSPLRVRSRSSSMSFERKDVDESGTEIPPQLQQPGPCSDEERQQSFEGSPPIMELLKNRDIRTMVISNFAMCLISELLFNVYPLFAYTPIELGGLGFSEAEIGLQMSIRAMVHLIALGLFNPIYRWLNRNSSVHVYQYAMMLWPIIAAFFPLLNIIARRDGTNSLIFNATTALFFFIWSFAGYCWVCAYMLAQEFSPSASTLAVINGIMQMSLTLPQVITPAFSNSLFAYSIEHKILGGQLVWVVLFAIACCSTIQSIALREPPDEWRTSQKRMSSES